ncbi:glycosyltransferase [Psychroflexus sp. CAK1W]|uniref:glycosyltransferase family 2 protein n=1 Tax=Psychroflexus curvus TaxID=2873595 RepID=UPI001CC989C1|nr:glycosyltransferase family 2 protein [Psychroflexus curvus]MBZ9628903.1 glycosyltransferase [Psychroflexus curvus]
MLHIKNKEPLVSVIIPTYNRAHLIGETLDSVLVQTYQNWECIIVDDGSSDNTDEIVEAYVKKDSRFQYHHRPSDRPKGANACRNYGFELSRGEYVNWFDDDDLMLEEFIKSKIKSFFGECKLIISGGYLFSNTFTEKKEMILEIKDNIFKDYVLWNFQIITNSVMFKKIWLTDKNLFKIGISRGQETEFFSRLFFKLPESDYVVIKKPLFLYRQHSDTKTFMNKSFRKDYIESKMIICIENLKRGIFLRDQEIIDYYYKNLIAMFFQVLKHHEIVLSYRIIKNIFLVAESYKILDAIKICFLLVIALKYKKSRSPIKALLIKQSLKVDL